MKKTFSLILVGLLMFSLVGTFVFAENETVIEEGLAISAEPIPVDSSTGVFWDRIQRGLTFNKEKKAEISLKISEKQILRAGECSEEGDYDCAQERIQKHEEERLRAEAYVEEIEANGDENETLMALQRTILLQNRIEANDERALEIKAGILERQADRITEEQLAHLEEVFSSIENHSSVAKERAEQHEEALRERYQELSGLSDEEVDAALEEYQGYLEQRREQRKFAVEEKEKQVEQRREAIQARDATGEFHDENLEEGGMNGSGLKGNQ